VREPATDSEVTEAAFASALKADGMRLTHQRLEIIRELARAEDHPDVDALFQRVRTRVPTISADTVYRTMAVLVDRGLVESIAMPRATRFDPDQRAHHHFLCEQCGRIEDVSADVVPQPSVPADLSGIGTVRSVRLQLRGVCSECSLGRKKPAGRTLA
jgi:Fur family peroxide stress response transcriptional regulator